MKELAGQIQPMIVQALVTAFQRSLAEELAARPDEDARPDNP